ncbi:MAG: hypothetical protein U1F43_03705 [Myxococcota bacterium]
MTRAIVDAAIGYRLHLLGLGGGSFEVQPGYLRTEEKLRRNVPRGLVAWATVDEALAAEVVPEADRAWFAKRWDAGEGRGAVELASAVDGLGWGAALPEVGLVVASPLRPWPCLAPTTKVVAVGSGTEPTLVALGAVALELEALYPRTLPRETRHFAALMAAGTRVAAQLPSEALDLLLLDVTRHVLPPQHRQEELAAHVNALVKADLLDQPPGEIERTIHGMGRRRADRVHRAWTRAFFVPRGARV